MKYNRGAGELEALLVIAAFIAGLIMLSGTHRDSADNQRPVYLTEQEMRANVATAKARQAQDRIVEAAHVVELAKRIAQERIAGAVVSNDTVTLSFEAGESTNLVAGQQVKVVTLKDPLVITVDEYNKIKQMQSEAQ